jgi:L-fuculose-phosphate aldolase
MTAPLERDLDLARTQVAGVCRTLAARGLVIGTAGNVSVRIGERIAVTATGARFEDLTADQVSVVTLDGKLAVGELEPTSELDLHLGIYRSYGSGAVVHTHAPVATAVGLVVTELPCVHYQMLLLGGAIRVAPYATFGTSDLAESVVGALAGRAAALMANHGAVTHAADLAAALDHALLLEWACTVYWRAAAMGTPRALDDEQQRAVVEAAIARNYGTTRPMANED